MNRRLGPFPGPALWIFENLGLTYLQLKRPDDARTAFARALRLNSQQPRALDQALTRVESGRHLQPRGMRAQRGLAHAAVVGQKSLGTRLGDGFQLGLPIRQRIKRGLQLPVAQRRGHGRRPGPDGRS